MKKFCFLLALCWTLACTCALGETLGEEYIVPHTEGETVVYTFEAENTNLTNKSGPAASGAYVGEQMHSSGIPSVK